MNLMVMSILILKSATIIHGLTAIIDCIQAKKFRWLCITVLPIATFRGRNFCGL